MAKTAKKKKEQTIIVTTQFTYILKGDKDSIDPKTLVEKVNEGFKKLADAGNQPWDDIIVLKAKVFERD